jgi:hypothetical protein
MPLLLPVQVTLPSVELAFTFSVYGLPAGTFEIEPSASLSWLTSIDPVREKPLGPVSVKFTLLICVVRPILMSIVAVSVCSPPAVAEDPFGPGSLELEQPIDPAVTTASPRASNLLKEIFIAIPPEVVWGTSRRPMTGLVSRGTSFKTHAKKRVDDEGLASEHLRGFDASPEHRFTRCCSPNFEANDRIPELGRGSRLFTGLLHDAIRSRARGDPLVRGRSRSSIG